MNPFTESDMSGFPELERGLPIPEVDDKFQIFGDERGLTPVLAVALLIGIFTSFFAAWFGAVVPVWQRDQERAHMTSVLDSFLTVKRAVEDMITLYLVDNAPDYSQTVDVRLSSEPIPLLGWLTTGSVKVENGAIKFNALNRYYVPQEWIYENGAVVLVQEDRSIMRASPSMVTVKSVGGGYIEVWVTLVEVRGENEIAGSREATIELELGSLQYENDNTPCTDVDVTVYDHLLAWQKYFGAKSDQINNALGSSTASRVDNTESYVKLTIYGTGSGTDIYYWQRRVRVNAYLL